MDDHERDKESTRRYEVRLRGYLGTGESYQAALGNLIAFLSKLASEREREAQTLREIEAEAQRLSKIEIEATP